MTELEQSEAALRCAEEMRIKASELRQLGFKELARWLNKNADAAMKWAGRKTE